MRWSYQDSRGLLHHKTLAVLVDGRPHTLVCGSFNWSKRSAKGYENLIVLTADDPASMPVMTAVEREFEALWSDGAATLSPDEVRTHYAAILTEFQKLFGACGRRSGRGGPAVPAPRLTSFARLRTPAVRPVSPHFADCIQLAPPGTSQGRCRVRRSQPAETVRDAQAGGERPNRSR